MSRVFFVLIRTFVLNYTQKRDLLGAAMKRYAGFFCLYQNNYSDWR